AGLPAARERVCHRMPAALAPKQPAEERAVLVADLRAARATVALEERLHAIEDFGIDDGLVLSVVRGAAMHDFPDVHRVRQRLGERALVERLPAERLALLGDATLVGPLPSREIRHHGEQRPLLEVEREDLAHSGGFDGVDDEARTRPG